MLLLNISIFYDGFGQDRARWFGGLYRFPVLTPLRSAHISHVPGEYFAKLVISANSAQNRGSPCINLLKSTVYVLQVQSTVKECNYCVILFTL